MCVALMSKVRWGSECLDDNTSGGLSSGGITLVYGEPETGKSTLAMQCGLNCARQKLKVLFVDCDGSFSANRLMQLAGREFEALSEFFLLVRPKDFAEQAAFVDRLADYVEKNFGLIVFDTFTSLYRLRVAEASGKAFALNRELNRQMAVLAQAAKVTKLPLLVLSQVSSLLSETTVSVAPVATRVLKFWADTIIAMKPTDVPQVINAVVEKSSLVKPSEDESELVCCYLRIDGSGIKDYPFHD